MDFLNNINTNNLNIKNIIIYLLILNALGFLFMLIDKKRAKKNEWRISESTLFGVALLGGSIGAIIGMYLFRHKTKKMQFIIGLPVIFILQIILVIYLFCK